MASSIEVRLLGPFRVCVDGGPVPDSRWRQRKAPLLLQRLALEPHHRLHVEQLMEALWPDASVSAARNSLHKTIHVVRSALEPDLRRPADSHFLVTHGQQLVLTAPKTLWIDVDVFRDKTAEAKRSGDPAAFESALALYRGRLLPEEPYEEWVAECRDQLDRIYRQLLMEAAEAHERRGESDRALEYFQQLVAADPSSEVGHRAVMRFHLASGDRQAALRQYLQCRDVLRRELDAEPDPATVQLYEEILGGASSTPQPRGLRVAVLPFENATADPAFDYLSDGMTESIIGNLSRLPQLHVMAHTTVSRYTGEDPRRAAEALGVIAVLTGTVLRRRGELISRVELIDASGSRLWGAEYELPHQLTVKIQEEISGAVAERLGITTDERHDPRRHSTENPEAYRLFLLGRHLWNKRTLDAVTKSIDYFRRAIDIDREFALAWIGIADSYAKLGDVGVAAIPPQEAFSKARKAAVRAVAIDSSLAEAHATLAHLFMHDYEWADAEREFRSAARLNPNYATVHHWFAYERMMRGKWEEAFQEIRRALELDPLSLSINTDYGELLYFARSYDAAIDQYSRALELDDRYYPVYFGLGQCLIARGDYHGATGAFESGRRLSGATVDVHAAMAYVAAAGGKKKRACELLRELDDIARTRYVSPYVIATVHAALGDSDEAFKWLNRACAEHAAWSIFVSVDPRLDPLRRDERFPAVLRSVGLEQLSA